MAILLFACALLAVASPLASADTLEMAFHHAAEWRLVQGHWVHTTRHVGRPPRIQPALDAPAYARPPNVQTAFHQPSPPADEELRLSPAALRVSRIAYWRGDRDFILVDKQHGVIILYMDGRPVFAGAALTGASLEDRLPPDALGKSLAEQIGVRYKVTPAGRYTANTAYDDSYGPVLDINEVHGRDWSLAIHSVVNVRTQNRTDRLRSASGGDKHITDGCVNVAADTMRQLTRFLPRARGIPVYILPMDDRLLTQLF